jgi:hypothetical protein
MVYRPEEFDGENNSTDAYNGGHDDGFADGYAAALAKYGIVE